MFNIFKKNLIIALAFIVFLIFTILYIERSCVDVVFLDGFMQVSLVERYFTHSLNIQDFVMQWGEHRLVGYTIIFLINSIIFGLNMKIEPYIFLFVYSMIGLLLYFPYKRVLLSNNKKDFSFWRSISYLSILVIIFSLIHPPGMLMTTQFVIGTLFFIISAIFFDRMCLGSSKWLIFSGFIFFITVYILIFSGANFVGALFSFFICFVFKRLFSNEKKITIQLFISVLIFIALVVGYLFITRMDQYDGDSLMSKVAIFLSRPGESFKSLLAGLSASILDIHTFQEILKGREYVVLLNGSLLFLLGLYSMYRFILLKIYEITYLPLMLIMYSIGLIFATRLGRLSGGWGWPMNEWYSFHLYFYLIGILWILYYDLFNRMDIKNGALAIFWRENKIFIFLLIFVLLYIFSFQTFSNLAQWRRAIHVRNWLDVKRQAILDPDGKPLEEILHWSKDDSLRCIAILKKHKLSCFREQKSGIPYASVINRMNGLYPDGWAGKNLYVRLTSGSNGKLSFSIYVPPDIFTTIYNNSIGIEVFIDNNSISVKRFSEGAFFGGPVMCVFEVPKNKTFEFKLINDKSFIPSRLKRNTDDRELSILVSKMKVE